MQDKKCCDSCENCECMENACCNGICSCCKKSEEPMTKEYLLAKKEKLEKKLQWVNEELQKMNK
jgi:hypothetical protein